MAVKVTCQGPVIIQPVISASYLTALQGKAYFSSSSLSTFSPGHEKSRYVIHTYTSSPAQSVVGASVSANSVANAGKP